MYAWRYISCAAFGWSRSTHLDNDHINASFFVKVFMFGCFVFTLDIYFQKNNINEMKYYLGSQEENPSPGSRTRGNKGKYLHHIQAMKKPRNKENRKEINKCKCLLLVITGADLQLVTFWQVSEQLTVSTSDTLQQFLPAVFSAFSEKRKCTTPSFSLQLHSACLDHIVRHILCNFGLQWSSQ